MVLRLTLGGSKSRTKFHDLEVIAVDNIESTSRLYEYLNAYTFEPAHDKTYKMSCAPSEDSGQPGHPPRLIRVFAVHSMDS